MLKNKILLLISSSVTFYNSIAISAAQSIFKEKVDQLKIIDDRMIGPTVSQQGNVSFSVLEKEFLRFRGKGDVKARDVVFYYLKNSKHGYDGLYGASSDSELRNVDNSDKYGNPIPNKPSQINYPNKITLYAKLNLKPSFSTVIINYETYDRISAFIYNYDESGFLISSMQILDNEKDGPDKVGKHSVISSTINKDGTIDIVTDADFRIDRKVKLDSDGHFRVIEEKVTRYDEN